MHRLHPRVPFLLTKAVVPHHRAVQVLWPRRPGVPARGRLDVVRELPACPHACPRPRTAPRPTAARGHVAYASIGPPPSHPSAAQMRACVCACLRASPVAAAALLLLRPVPPSSGPPVRIGHARALAPCAHPRKAREPRFRVHISRCPPGPRAPACSCTARHREETPNATLTTWACAERGRGLGERDCRHVLPSAPPAQNTRTHTRARGARVSMHACTRRRTHAPRRCRLHAWPGAR